MYKSDCYNYEWFVDWLRRSLVPNLVPQYLLSAENIAKNFTSLYFEVSIEDVVNAMEEIGYTSVIKQGEKFYSVSYTENIKKSLWKIWN